MTQPDLQQTNKSYLERPPRIQPVLPINEVEIPAPPEDKIQQQTLLELLLPGVMVAGYVVMAISGVGRSLALVVPMAVAMVGSIWFSMKRNQAAKDELERQKQQYDAMLADMRYDLDKAHDEQRHYYTYNYPPVGQIVDIAGSHYESLFGSRIWERRPEDDDFAMLRLGEGTRESTVTYKYTQDSFTTSEQAQRARRLANDSHNLEQTPITLALRPTIVADPRMLGAMQHALGIYSVSRTLGVNQPAFSSIIYEYMYSLLSHFAAFHAPTDASLYIVKARSEDHLNTVWGWVRNLPHVGSGRNQQICDEDDDMIERKRAIKRLPSFWKDLLTTLQKRQQRLEDDENAMVGVPFILLIVDMLDMQADSQFVDIETNETISFIIKHGPQLGVSVIFLVDEPPQIPSEVKSVIELETLGDSITSFRYAETGTNSPRFVGKSERITFSQAETIAKLLNKYLVRVTASAALPGAVTLMDVHEATNLPELHIIKNWMATRGADHAEWPTVSLAKKSGVEIRKLVFEANQDGVHSVIAGTTGSGKSELLQSLILGLAIRYDPSVLNFVLVDFKGGAAFEEFKPLPHCVDIVTNLEGNAVERMFSAIKAELDRRGELIAKNGVKHIIEYREKNLHQTVAPFPYLFIIIDEFAEMVAENAEYKSQLDSITRLGRAIGVSLILATQRPTGMVTDQMRANMKLKICLRVETTDDSREILKRSDAAYLPTTIPGRGYIQIGNEIPELVQIAWSGADYVEQGAEQPVVIWMDADVKDEAEITLSKVIVDYMASLAKNREHRIPPQRKPWPAPLPKYLPLGAPLTRGKDNDTSQDILDTTYLIPEDRLHLAQSELLPPDNQPLYLSRALALWTISHLVNPVWDKETTPSLEKLLDTDLRRHQGQSPYVALLNKFPLLYKLLDQNPNIAELLLGDISQLVVLLEAYSPLSNDIVPGLYPRVFAEMRKDKTFKQLIESNTILALVLEHNSLILRLVLGDEGVLGRLVDVPLEDDQTPAKALLDAWLDATPKLRKFLFRNPMLLALVRAKNAGTLLPMDELRANVDFDNVMQTNPLMFAYLSENLAAAKLFYQHPFLLKLLDQHPHLTDMLQDDPTLINDIRADNHLSWNVNLKWANALQPVIGIMDNPYSAEQRLLKLNLSQNHVAIFGAGGSGKSTTLRSIVATLVAEHHPKDLHLYILDYGGRNLTLFEKLPHVGAVITPDETKERERLERLLRFLTNEVIDRSRLFNAQNVDSLVAYNQQLPAKSLPALVIVIDNYGDIRQNYEEYEQTFINLLREGRKVGIHFIVTGNLPSSLGSKIYNQINTRLALYLIDRTEYTGIAGRGGATISEIAGRGLVKVDRLISDVPLEFHIGVPIYLTDGELKTAIDINPKTGEERIKVDLVLATLNRLISRRLEETLVQPMSKVELAAYKEQLAKPIDVLPTFVHYNDILAEVQPEAFTVQYPALLGIEDQRLQPFMLPLETRHFIILGPPVSGRTTLMQTWILSLAHAYSPEEVAIVLIDPRQDLMDYGGEGSLEDLPHVITSVRTPKDFERFLFMMQFEYEEKFEYPQEERLQKGATRHRIRVLNERRLANQEASHAQKNGAEAGEQVEVETLEVTDENMIPVFPQRRIIVFIDNVDDIGDIASVAGADRILGTFVDRQKGKLHFVISGPEDLRRQNELVKKVSYSRSYISLRSNKAIETAGGKVQRHLRDKELEIGRGYYIRPNEQQLVQIATFEPPVNDTRRRSEIIDEWIQAVLDKNAPRSLWYYDMMPEVLLDDLAYAEDVKEQKKAQDAVVLSDYKKPIEVMDFEGIAASSRLSQVSDLLSAENLRKLTPELLQTIDVTVIDDKFSDLITNRADEIARMMVKGSVGIPETLNAAHRELVEKRIAVYNTLQPANLLKLDVGLLSAIPFDYGKTGFKAQDVLNQTQFQLDTLFQTGAIKMPVTLDAALKEQIDRTVRVRTAVTPAKLNHLTHDLFVQLQEAGMDFGNQTLEDLKTARLDDIQTALRHGIIKPPHDIAETLVVAINDYEVVYNSLVADRLNCLPISLLKALKIDFGDLAIEDVCITAPDVLQAMIQDEQVKLPPSITQAQQDAIRDSWNRVRHITVEQVKNLPIEIATALGVDMEAVRTQSDDDLRRLLVEGDLLNLDALTGDIRKQIRNLKNTSMD